MGSSNKLVVVNYIDIQQISCSAQTGAAFALAGLMLSFLGTATTMYNLMSNTSHICMTTSQVLLTNENRAQTYQNKNLSHLKMVYGG